MRIVSACLAGVKCRFDGEARSCERVIGMVRNGEAIPVCPEQLGGLSTPRDSAEIKNGKIMGKDGRDFSVEFERGSREALKIVKLAGCSEAILKSKSPSCGCGKIFDGSFSGVLIEGDGVFTKLLKENGIRVLNEKHIL